jgi:hypothetical protein
MGIQVSQPYPPYTMGYRPDWFGRVSQYDTALDRSDFAFPNPADPTTWGVEQAFWFTNFPASQGDCWLSTAKLMWADGSGNWVPVPGLNIVVSALFFAERGTFFIIPGEWFDSTVKPTDPNNAWALYRRYNYAITINGAIVVDETPSLSDVAEWANKWAWPADASGSQWFSVTYNYDPGLLRSRLGGLPAVPRLPVGPELIDAGLGG